MAFFNPYSGPPEGEDAWLARVASPVADDYLASQQPGPGAQEVLAAGFTHQDRDKGARGFAAGGPLDVMEPGPVLAGFADDAVGDGLGALSDDELIGVLCAARRLASWSASVELGAVSQLAARRDAHAAAIRDSRQADHVADEVAVALRLTCRAADKLLGLAAGVRRLPAVAAALAAGRVDVPKAIVFCDELAGLNDVQAAAVADVTIGDAAGLTTGELHAVLHREVLAADPEAARKRRKRAQKDARVEAWAESRGTAALAGRDLPPADVLAADKRIDATARALKTAGAEGTLEQLRAKVFIALLTSQPLYTLLPGNQDSHRDGDSGGGNGHDGRPGEGNDDAPGDENGSGGARRPGPGSGPSGGAPGSTWPAGPGLPPGLTGSVNLTIPLTTWLGLTSSPGEAAGYGPLDPDTSRGLAAAIAAQPGNRWCLTIVHPDGRAAGHGCARTGPPASTGPPGQRAGPGPPGPGSNPWPPGQRNKPGPPGQRNKPGPPGQRNKPGPPGQRNKPGPPGPGGDPRAWLAGITIRWLETGACGHPRETRAYQPSPALRHLVKIRDRTCSFPGCRRAARHCDDDHTIPFDQRGRTCECNLSPLCRRHHAAKQAPGWLLEQPRQPGTLIWTLPSGRQHTVTPRPYPA
ncbi:MAG TPA: hypothetical protein VK162_22100 [Streptosporangiaceae bacterium]|nr:hypothetical protein [Streptosporangiaceae bacterium]